MDDYEDYSDYDDYESGGDVFDEEDDYDDEFYGGEDDGEEEEEEGEEVEEDEEEEENEEGDQEEEEDAEDEMEDYEEEEEITDIGEQYDADEEIVEDRGVEIDDEAEEDLVQYEESEEEEEEEEALMEEEEDEEELLEEEEEEDEEDEDDEGSYEDETDFENEIAAWEPHYLPRGTARAPFPAISTPFLSGAEFPRPRFHNVESGFSDLSEDGGGLRSSGSDWRRNESGDGTASSRPTEVVASREIESSGSNDSSLAGFQGTNCPICFECWTGEGEHCVCCLPCGHLYGLSCIKMWLQRPNSQKCPQCNDACELADVRRLYGLQLAITGVEELHQKVKCLEAKCASLELKDTDWLRKEAKWQKREADLQEQLNQHKEGKTELLKDIRERPDPVDDPEPVNALRHMKL